MEQRLAAINWQPQDLNKRVYELEGLLESKGEAYYRSGETISRTGKEKKHLKLSFNSFILQ